jgi:hypothetical protein
MNDSARHLFFCQFTEVSILLQVPVNGAFIVFNFTPFPCCMGMVKKSLKPKLAGAVHAWHPRRCYSKQGTFWLSPTIFEPSNDHFVDLKGDSSWSIIVNNRKRLL